MSEVTRFGASTLKRFLRVATELWGSPRVRLATKIGFAAFAVGMTAFAGWRFSSTGLPFSHGKPLLIMGAGLLFLVAYPIKAWGWRKLFAPNERPKTSALAAAGGAAAVGGVALPGRFDDIIRVAVVRRYPNCPAGVRALVFSLFALGLIDAVALTPLASTSAALTHSTGVRIALALVAGAGVAAALVIVVLPRVMACGRLIRFRLARWIQVRSPSIREAAKAAVLVHASWLVRAVGVLLLLGGLGLGLSFHPRGIGRHRIVGGRLRARDANPRGDGGGGGRAEHACLARRPPARLGPTLVGLRRAVTHGNSRPDPACGRLRRG